MREERRVVALGEKTERKKERGRQNALRHRDKLSGGFVEAEKTCRVTQATKGLDTRKPQKIKGIYCVEDETHPFL